MVFVNFERVSKKFVEKMNPITVIIQVIYVHLRSPCFNIYLKNKSSNFEIQRIFCCSRYIALRFQLLQCACLTDGRSIFYKRKEELLD